jgi:endoribonuclease Dicer
MGDKSVADVSEVTTGATFLDKGLNGVAEIVSSTLTSDHTQETVPDVYIPILQEPPPSVLQKLADDIEAQFKYKFKSPTLLMSAFRPPSNPSLWKIPNNQRLRSLGMSLPYVGLHMIFTKLGTDFLGLACVEFLFKSHPEADPASLTRYKCAMVSHRFLGAISVILGFHKRVGEQLDPAIEAYSAKILLARESSDTPNFWTDPGIMEPPKTLPAVLEAFIGALAADSEFNPGVVRDFFNAAIRPYFVDLSLYEDFIFQHNPCRLLAKKLIEIGCYKWNWETFKENRMAFLIHGITFTTASVGAKKGRRSHVAKAALEKLNSLGPEELRELCTCPKLDDDDDDDDGEERRRRRKKMRMYLN